MPFRRAVVMLSKPPVAGLVKTRLIGEFNAQEAAELHAAFLTDLFSTLRSFESARLGNCAWVAWANSSTSAKETPEAPSAPSAPIAAFGQANGDLGKRLHHALARLLDGPEGADAAIAIGSDLPTLDVARLDEAFGHLEAGAPLVLGPSSDGGYYLIGVRREALDQGLFREIPWSTERVLDTTLDRAVELGLAFVLLGEESDIDTPADLARLRRRLSVEPQLDCAKTRRAIDRLEVRPEQQGLGAAAR